MEKVKNNKKTTTKYAICNLQTMLINISKVEIYPRGNNEITFVNFVLLFLYLRFDRFLYADNYTYF